MAVMLMHQKGNFCLLTNLSSTHNANTFLWSAAVSTNQELSRAAFFCKWEWQAITTKFVAFQMKFCDKPFNNGVSTERFQFLATNQFCPGECTPKILPSNHLPLPIKLSKFLVPVVLNFSTSSYCFDSPTFYYLCCDLYCSWTDGMLDMKNWTHGED